MFSPGNKDIKSTLWPRKPQEFVTRSEVSTAYREVKTRLPPVRRQYNYVEFKTQNHESHYAVLSIHGEKDLWGYKETGNRNYV